MFTIYRMTIHQICIFFNNSSKSVLAYLVQTMWTVNCVPLIQNLLHLLPKPVTFCLSIIFSKELHNTLICFSGCQWMKIIHENYQKTMLLSRTCTTKYQCIKHPLLIANSKIEFILNTQITHLKLPTSVKLT